MHFLCGTCGESKEHAGGFPPKWTISYGGGDPKLRCPTCSVLYNPSELRKELERLKAGITEFYTAPDANLSPKWASHFEHLLWGHDEAPKTPSLPPET